jgi:AAA15 family ATPase/GTPase
MLDSITVKNYRNLAHLEIPTLSRVNLITGKNNTGKTSLLEAIALCVTNDILKAINIFLKNRGEDLENGNQDFTPSQYASMFAGRDFNFNIENTISISGKNTESDIEPYKTSIRFFHHRLTTAEFNDNNTFTKHVINNSTQFETRLSVPVLELISKNQGSLNYFFNSNLHTDFSLPNAPKENFTFAHANQNDLVQTANLWDQVILTPKEEDVISALKIIEKDIERIALTGNSRNIRKFIIKTTKNKATFPLASMGDGMNRILEIILAMVNADNRYLFIDEIENGLHYSVQEKLWEVIFKLSKELNIQVFATTHSMDSITSFAKVQATFEGQGQYIRLQNRDGKIVPVEYTSEEITSSTQSSIDPR